MLIKIDVFQKLTSDFSLFHLVREMRRQRIAMVQTKDQYIMVHRAVKELFEEQLKIIDSHPYANVDVLGLPIDIKADLEEPTYETIEYNATSNHVAAAQYHHQPSTSVPPIPPPHVDLTINSKLEKEVDTHCSRRRDSEIEEQKQKADQEERRQKPIRWRQQQKFDDITVLSSDGEEVEKEVVSRNKKLGEILRKPSIVKIKSFFEKSKDSKKSGGTNLSRAKSDVSSSKFYAFNNIAASFGSRQSRKSPTPSLDVDTNHIEAGSSASSSKPSSSTVVNSTTATGNSSSSSSSKQQKPAKPPLFAKPLLPIKRSKSLKLGKEDSSIEQVIVSRHVPKQVVPTDHLLRVPTSTTNSLQQSSSSSSVSNVSSYPIKVCIKQVEIPEMKKPVSTSVKPEIQTATTLELNKQSSLSGSSSSGSWTRNKKSDSSSNTSSATASTSTTGGSSTKPLIPPKSSVVKETIGLAPSQNHRIKMGVAKEMEDVADFGRQSSKHQQLQKYDTVVIKGPPSNSKRTSLTRSQSHVWQQPAKVQTPFRIFSDENIHQSGGSSGNTTATALLNLTSQPLINHQSSSISSQRNGRRTFGSFDDSTASSSSKSSSSGGGVNIKVSSAPTTLESFNSGIDIKPIVRRRVPKTNPYANYTPGGGGGGVGTTPNNNSSPPPTLKSSWKNTTTSKIITSSSSVQTPTILDNRIPKDLPQLKPGYSRSRQNSSESSSNTATPRSSLPGTPTQTIDSTYAQIMRSNMQGLLGASKNFGRNNNGATPPKSILKGSLSSTPSESDERLDERLDRQSPSLHGTTATKLLLPNSSNSNSVTTNTTITPPQKINAVSRIALGIRERRNSFRQAVCKDKEDQQQPKDAEYTRELFTPENNNVSRIFSDGGGGGGGQKNVISPNSASGVRSHKDYEPIWPENGPYHFSNGGGGGFAIVSDDSYINRAPLKPQQVAATAAQQPPPMIPVPSSNYRAEPPSATSSGSSSNRQPIYAKSNRSHSAERTLQTYQNSNSQPFQSRFDEIKLLLEELKAPNEVTQMQQQLLATNSKSSYSAMPYTTTAKNLEAAAPTPTTPATTSGVSLKHQRSLRTPSKPQYPGGSGLSCFTFKKPSSLESLTDSFHYDVMTRDTPSINGDTTPLLKQNGFGDSSATAVSPRRNSNDYVSLRQGRPAYEATVHQSYNSTTPNPRMDPHNSHIGSNGVPIAPPRTKKLQKSNSTIVPMSGGGSYHMDKSLSGVGSTSSSGWPMTSSTSTSDVAGNVSSRNLPEVVRCSSSHQADRQTNTTTPPSPKTLVKAMGIFQAKAANMRSKLSSWSDSREKEKSSNGYTSAAERDEIDGGTYL